MKEVGVWDWFVLSRGGALARIFATSQTAATHRRRDAGWAADGQAGTCLLAAAAHLCLVPGKTTANANHAQPSRVPLPRQLPPAYLPFLCAANWQRVTYYSISRRSLASPLFFMTDIQFLSAAAT